MDSFCCSFVHQLSGNSDLLIFYQGLPHVVFQGLQESRAHTAGNEQGIDLIEYILQYSYLVAYLRAADDSRKGALWVVQGFTHNFKLSFNKEASY